MQYPECFRAFRRSCIKAEQGDDGFKVRILFLWCISILFECSGYDSSFSSLLNCVLEYLPLHLITYGFPHLNWVGKGAWEVDSFHRSVAWGHFPHASSQGYMVRKVFSPTREVRCMSQQLLKSSPWTPRLTRRYIHGCIHYCRAPILTPQFFSWDTWKDRCQVRRCCRPPGCDLQRTFQRHR